jgi:hypothetical protein
MFSEQFELDFRFHYGSWYFGDGDCYGDGEGGGYGTEGNTKGGGYGKGCSDDSYSNLINGDCKNFVDLFVW